MGRITIYNDSKEKNRLNKYFGVDYNVNKSELDKVAGIFKIDVDPVMNDVGEGFRGVAYEFKEKQGRIIIKVDGVPVADSLWVKNDINKDKILGSFNIAKNKYDDTLDGFIADGNEAITILESEFAIGEDSIGSGVLFYSKFATSVVEILIHQIESPDFNIYFFGVDNFDAGVTHSSGVIKFTNDLGYYPNSDGGDNFFRIPNLFSKYANADASTISPNDVIIISAWGHPESVSPTTNTLDTYLNPVLSSELRLNGNIVSKYDEVSYLDIINGNLLYYPNGINDLGRITGGFELFIDYTIKESTYNSLGVDVEFLGRIYEGNRRARLQILDFSRDTPISDVGNAILKGAVSEVLYTGEEIKNTLGSTAIDVMDDFTFETGTVFSKFMIIIPIDKTIDSVANIGTGEFYTFSKHSGTVEMLFNGILGKYDVYSLSNAVPFSHNYTIKVKLL